MEKASLFIMIKREEYVGRLVYFPNRGAKFVGKHRADDLLLNQS
jgi:hypothetical protein